ncbi:hypothetical protein PO124_02255 [Bacillus licheniformis]|nr:hypothetical protein [Bacillus licheniformis]
MDAHLSALDYLRKGGKAIYSISAAAKDFGERND